MKDLTIREYSELKPDLKAVYNAWLLELKMPAKKIEKLIERFPEHFEDELENMKRYQSIPVGLKERFEGKKLWLRNLVSTPISQALDSSVFVLIAFYGVLPNLGEFILFVWAVKVAIAIVDTPFIYLSYRVLGKKYRGSNKVAAASDPQ